MSRRFSNPAAAPPAGAADAVAGTLAEIRRLMARVSRDVERTGRQEARSEVEHCCAAATDLVCREMRLTPRQLRARTRSEAHVVGRWAIMWLARKVGGFSDRQIGGHLKQHHTNICHGIRRMAEMIETQPALAKKMAAAQEELARRLGC